MPYYPMMAYRTVDLEGRLRPPTGLGDLPATDWCSTANRQGTCKPIANICLPTNAATLEVFKNLQRQVNRILSKVGKTLIGVDGRIGPGTMKGVADAFAAAGAAGAESYAQAVNGPCDQIARAADVMATRLYQYANQASAPLVADPRSSRPSTPTTSGGVAHPSTDVIVATASQGDLMSALSSPIGIASMAVFGLVIFKGTKGGTTKRRRARRRSR